MPCSYPHHGITTAPPSLVKGYRIEAADTNGMWRTVYRERDNSQRLVRIPLQIEAAALRFVAEETWGDPLVRLFNFEPLDAFSAKIPEIPEGQTFTEVRSKVAPEDLAPPRVLSRRMPSHRGWAPELG